MKYTGAPSTALYIMLANIVLPGSVKFVTLILSE